MAMPITAPIKLKAGSNRAAPHRSRSPLLLGRQGTARAVRVAAWRRCTQRSARNASRAGSSSKTLTTAPISKRCWPITCLYTSVASMAYWPPITLGTPKSVNTRINTTKPALTRP